MFQARRVPDSVRAERLQQNFELHRISFLEAYFPEGSIVNTTFDHQLDNWSSCQQVVRSLRNLLPFGRHLEQWELDTFISSSLVPLVAAAREQLLYWHLTQATNDLNDPIDLLILTEEPRLFWEESVPPFSGEIRNNLHNANRVHYLTQFLLSNQKIEVTFNEIRLVNSPVAGTGLTFNLREELVATDGIELSYKWQDRVWETTLRNPDPNLINPEEFHRPNLVPAPVATVAAATVRNEIESRPVLPRTPSPLPPSSPGTSVWNDWGVEPRYWNTDRCRCKKEVCDCGYRPDTPPTPPNIVLWAPRFVTLPYNE